jgi:peptidoglycan/LPS O-acetylase OafA/YrhL
MIYRREIDGLRAVAVIPVMLFHAGFGLFGGGFVGVDVFFVISGYLITSIIIAELEAGKFSIVNFYERRARRILPALFFVMALCIPAAWLWLLPDDMEGFSQSLVAVTMFSSNILFWQQSGYFDVAAELKPLLHTWSLGVEEQFYVVFPLFLALTWKLGKSWIVVILMFLAAASLTLTQLGVLRNPTATFFLLPTRGWELAIGAFAAIYLSKQRHDVVGRPLSESFSVLGLLLVLYSIFAFSKSTPFPSVYALVPTVGTALIILFATPHTMVGNLLGRGALVGIGLVSYSAYLWHQPLLAFARHRDANEPNTVVLLLLLLVTLFLAYFSWRYVEQPFRRRGRIDRSKIFSFAGAASVFFLVFGVAGYYTNGFIFRYSDSDIELIGDKQRQDEYVWHRMRFLNHRAFDDSKHKILIVGDSFAGDFVNAISEAGHSSGVSFSTYILPARCGNLYLKTRLSEMIDFRDRRVCARKGWYDNMVLHEFVRQAHEIWLVSSWQPWQIEYLPASIANLESNFGRKFMVVGSKSYGKIHLRGYLGLSSADRPKLVNVPTADHVEINRRMETVLGSSLFFNLSDYLCEEGQCRLFDGNGRLISYDGGHLTSAGAIYVGQRLAKHPRFGKVFSKGQSFFRVAK